MVFKVTNLNNHVWNTVYWFALVNFFFKFIITARETTFIKMTKYSFLGSIQTCYEYVTLHTNSLIWETISPSGSTYISTWVLSSSRLRAASHLTVINDVTLKVLTMFSRVCFSRANIVSFHKYYYLY